jgi:hypothetical protein
MQCLFQENPNSARHFPLMKSPASGYPPPMRHNAVIQDSTKGSFAGLLEHLTRRLDQEGVSGSVVRSYAPVAERKPTLDGAPLSYETALRLHARHRTDSRSKLDPPEAPRPGIGSPAAAAATSKASKTPDRVDSPLARPQSKSGTKPSSIKSKIKSQLKAKPKARPSQRKALAKLDRSNMLLDIGNRTAQRRAIVSLRMTDDELLKLKDRAAESGISVSAYMRSCILDADQLRSQVRQALAEMRAISSRPEPSDLPALASPEGKDAGKANGWPGLLLRSAAFLLGPFLSLRRNG